MNENMLISNYIKNNKLDVNKVVLEYSPYIYTILKNQAIRLSNEDVEEIISDVFLAVWKNQDKLDVDRYMSSYIAGITKNLIKKRNRNLIEYNDIEDYEEKLIAFNNIEIEYENNERNQIIMKKLNSMKEEDRNIFMLYYYQSKKIKEIVLELNISQSKVKSKLHTIRKKLKKVFEKEAREQ